VYASAGAAVRGLLERNGAQYERLAPRPPPRGCQRSSRRTHRAVLNALCRINQESRWSALPEHCSRWHSASRRLNRSVKRGLLARGCPALRGDQLKPQRPQALSRDLTIIQAAADGAGTR